MLSCLSKYYEKIHNIIFLIYKASQSSYLLSILARTNNVNKQFLVKSGENPGCQFISRTLNYMEMLSLSAFVLSLAKQSFNHLAIRFALTNTHYWSSVLQIRNEVGQRLNISCDDNFK